MPNLSGREAGKTTRLFLFFTRFIVIALCLCLFWREIQERNDGPRDNCQYISFVFYNAHVFHLARFLSVAGFVGFAGEKLGHRVPESTSRVKIAERDEEDASGAHGFYLDPTRCNVLDREHRLTTRNRLPFYMDFITAQVNQSLPRVTSLLCTLYRPLTEGIVALQIN